MSGAAGDRPVTQVETLVEQVGRLQDGAEELKQRLVDENYSPAKDPEGKVVQVLNAHCRIIDHLSKETDGLREEVDEMARHLAQAN